MTEIELDFAIIKKAGLSQQDFADLCGVSRVTVNLWVNGKTPSRFLKEKLSETLMAIAEADALGKLPQQKGRKTTRSKRLGDLKAAIWLPN
jgi:transcriptional regulator with XRE-family HTH domain